MLYSQHHLPKEITINDQKKRTEAGAIELSEEDMKEVQAGIGLEIAGKKRKKAGEQAAVVGSFKSVSGMEIEFD